MPINEEKALEILAELIKKPESKAEDVPRIWSEIMGVFNTQFAPPVEEPKKKRRRRGPANPNLGWPVGVSRAEYKVWKDVQLAKGVSENLNPQEYKRQREAGISLPSAAASTASKSAKADKPVADKKAPAKKTTK